jgi:endo-1,3(4)-beta-glucanase
LNIHLPQHSFASGLFPFANGKSQESSSEAVNCYYGAYLWSKVRWGNSGDSKMMDFARLLLATELTGAKNYWHMAPSQNNQSGEDTHGGVRPVTYPNEFRKNFMVGNLGMTDVVCTTWFGTDNIYVHLINFLPVTAITSELFDEGKQHVFENKRRGNLFSLINGLNCMF